MSALRGRPSRVNLAHEPDFRLGQMLVCPSACRVNIAGREQRLEPRVMEVLLVLARAPNRTFTREELIESCWEGRFVSDDAITRVIGRVRDLARGFDPPPFRIETLPKVGFRLVAAGAGEAENTAVVQLAARAPPPAVAQRRWRPPLLLALAIALLAVAAVVVWRATGTGTGGSAGQSGRVEVVLFEPLRRDPDLQRLSVALGDAIVRLLISNGVQAARPVPRDTGGRAGGAELRVAGTIDRDSDKYVINAQVLDRRSGLVIWSQRFDRATAHSADFQEEAAGRIADGLSCALSRRAKSPQAMGHNILGMLVNACLARRGDHVQLLEAARHLVRSAPELSAAHSIHAVAQAIAATESDGSEQDLRALRAAARSSANEALRINPQNAEAYLGLALSYPDGAQWAARERYFARALQLDPDLTAARNLYIDLLREVGRNRDALETNQRSAAADPLSPAQPARLAMLYAMTGDLPRAYALVRQVDLLSPEAGQDIRLTIAVWWEDPATARRALPTFREIASAADLACYDAWLQRLERPGPAPPQGLPATCARVSADWRVRMLARQGDIDGAYREASRPWPNSRRHTMYLFYPEMKAFRQDARFMPFAKRIGLVDYWTQTNRWPDFCAEPDLPYDCRAVAKQLQRQPS